MPVGKTRDAGWQIGVYTTVGHPAAEVWRALVSPEGLEAWLGAGVRFTGSKKEPYRTDDGVAGELRSFRPNDRIRLTWRPPGREGDTTVQIALEDKGGRTGVRFHQERLADAEEREAQRRHWKRAAADFTALLDGQHPPPGAASVRG